MSFIIVRSCWLITRAPYPALSRKVGRAMASQRTAAGKAISETAKAEDGLYKGSNAAEMQSQVAKTRNFEQAAEEVAEKMRTNPTDISSEV